MPASTDSGSLVRFGVFEADLHSDELYKCGVKVRIQELPFQALKLFLSRPNEVLSRGDLRHALWPNGVFVEFDRGIISAINRLRETLGDHAENPVFIETVGRRGYRWIAPTQFFEPPRETTANVQPKSEVTRLHWNYLLIVMPVAALALVLWVWTAPPGSSDRAKDRVQPAGSRFAYAHPSLNREAEEFYLKGRYYWEKRTPDSLNKAVDSFTQAIVHDPTYAPAYVGLADSYNLLREYTLMPAPEAYSRSLAASEKAVELDPQYSDAHASLAFVSFYGMWDAAKADREFRRAIDLNPDNAAAHHWYATYLSCLHRLPESLTEIDRAQALDPASKSILADKGAILFSAGRRQDAVALLHQTEEIDPEFISPHRYLKGIYLRTGDYPGYLAEARKEAILMRDNSALAMVEVTEKAFAAGGGRGLLEALSRQQKKLYDRGELSAWFLAQTLSIMGSKTEALRYLKIAYDQREEGIPQVESDPAFTNLYHEPAFRKLLVDAGLPPID